MAFEKVQPSYAGNGVSIWKAIDKNGKEYLKVKVLGSSNNIFCFKVEENKA